MMIRLLSTTRRRRAAAVLGLTVVTALALPGEAASGFPTASAAAAVPTAATAPGRAAPATGMPGAATPAVAVGKLAARGCTRAGTTDTCDLYAAAGSVSIVGSALIPIWGFSTTSPGPVTAPGPLLVVPQGDTVTVRLHNALPAGQQLSLAFPGIPASDFSAGLSPADTQTGVAPGSSATYTFTASRPGTYLYEAGHTADGGRQVAMGLAGALVVQAGDGTAYGASGPAYDDEAVVVLSEVDPALNANPTGFDMRSFHPAYRLINGNAFPEIPAVATDQAHKVLLRYVNAGAQQHPMSLLGATQSAVARAGRLLAYAENEVVAALDPGATEDTLVTMPSGPESKTTLFEVGTHLDNNAQHTADPLQLAFGGMMTVLDTAAPPPTTDSVGPVASAVAASPNPATGLADVSVTATISDATTGGSVVDGAEIVLDDAVATAPGAGLHPMTLGVSGATGVTATGTITVTDMASLPAGKHVVYVRGHDAAGSGNWGVVGSVVLNLPKTGPATTGGAATPALGNRSVPVTLTATGDDGAAGGLITGAEFFVTDTATLPALTADTRGTAMKLNRSATVVAETGTIPVASIPVEGQHHAWVRSLDSLGLWGPLLDIPFTVDTSGPAVLGAGFGPNPTNGLVSDKANPGYAVVSAKIQDQNAAGVQSPLTAAEAFLDPGAAPATGTGLDLVATDGAFNSPTEDVYGLIPLTQLRSLADGPHQVLVRGKDAAGNWGAPFLASFTVDKTPPVLTQPGATATPNPTNGAAALTFTVPYADASNTIGLAEFWVGADPGPGRGTAVAVSSVGTGVATLTIPLAGLPPGLQTFSVRIQDKAGNWSNVVSLPVTVVPPPLVSETFNSGALTAGGWTSTGTAASVTAAANLPATAPGAFGLQVAYPAGPPTAAAFVSKAFGTTLTTTHVAFDVNAAGLATGAATPTILSATNPAGGPVFTVQLRTQGSAKQVRTTMTTTNARGVVGTATGPWVTLPTGAVTLTLDWRSGPAAAGPAQGSLALRVGASATAASTTTGNTSTAGVAGISLGVVTGVTNAVKGLLFADNITVTR